MLRSMNIPTYLLTPSSPSSTLHQSPLLFVGLFLVAIVLFQYFTYRPRRTRSAATSGPLRVSGLFIYPVKSCAGIPLTKAEYNRLGFLNDRSFMLISTQSGQHLAQREYPRMALVQPAINHKKKTLTLTLKGGDANDTLTVPLHPSLKTNKDQLAPKRIRVFEDEIDGLVFTDPAISAWFARALEVRTDRSVSLACILGTDEHQRPFQPTYDRTDPSLRIQPPLSDQAPFLLTTSASLEALNQWTNSPAQQKSERGGRQVEHAAFRPSIIIDGKMHAWEEDTWKKIKIVKKAKKEGDNAAAASASSSATATPQTFWVAKPCARCVLTTVDPSVGKFHPSGEPLLALREHRKIMPTIPSEADSPIFGQLLMQDQDEGVIEIGDEIEILEYKPNVYDPVREKAKAADITALEKLEKENE